jgi:hypothetical protein
MARTGRPKEAHTRDARVSLRISKTLHEALNHSRNTRAEADRRSHSLNEEIELRLWEAVNMGDRLASHFGGEENAVLFEIITQLIGKIETGSGGGNWLDSPFMFEQAMQAITTLLETLRPPGDAQALPETVRRWAPSAQEHVKNIGQRSAFDALALLRAALAEVPSAKLPATLYHKATATLGKRLKQLEEGESK